MSTITEKTKPIRLDSQLLVEVSEARKNRPEYPTDADFIEEGTRRFIDLCRGIKH